jgi:hypothetical protein
MELGIGFQIIRSNNDALNLRVAAWNGLFGGVAEIYVAIGDLQVAARQLRGFPDNPADKRVIELGCFDRKYAGGSVIMNFHCGDGAGHVCVETTIDSNCIKAGTIQTVILTVPIDASDVEHFVKELARLEFKSAGTAHLSGVREAIRVGG